MGLLLLLLGGARVRVDDLRARELGAPRAQRELGRDGAALREAEEVDACGGPAAVAAQVREDGGEQRERRGRVGVRQELAERVEGGVPLVGLLVEEGDPAYTILTPHCTDR